MVEWLHMEEMPLEDKPAKVQGRSAWGAIEGDFQVDTGVEGGGAVPPTPPASSKRSAAYKTRRLDVSLRAVKILDNRELFGPADTIIYPLVLDGKWNPKSGFSLALKSFAFPRVKDGDILPIGPDRGVVVYDGTPVHFLNLHIIAVRNTQATRRLREDPPETALP